jgi:hypothetical protein
MLFKSPTLSLLTVYIISFGCSGQENVYKGKVDNVVNVERMPYFPELTGDSIFWEITRDRKIIPYLIERISDTTRTKAPVLFFGGDYSIGDICLTAIEQLIHGFSTVYLIEKDEKVIDEKGYNVYWEFVRSSFENRNEFQIRVKAWYKENKRNLVWVEDNNLYPIEDKEGSVMKKIPAGGFYQIKKGR